MGLCPRPATVCQSVWERWSDEAGCLPTLGIRSHRGLHACLSSLVDVTDFRLSRSSGENRVGGCRDVDAYACAFVPARMCMPDITRVAQPISRARHAMVPPHSTSLRLAVGWGSDNAHKAHGFKAMRHRWLGRCNLIDWRNYLLPQRRERRHGSRESRAWYQIRGTMHLLDAQGNGEVHSLVAHPQRSRSHL